jgi:hypothetical protein
VTDHAGTHRVHFNVTHTREEIPISLNRTRLVTTIPKSSCAAFNTIHITRLAPGNATHQLSKRRNILAEHDDQMHVVRHQAIRENPNAQAGLPLAERIEICLKIFIAREYTRPIMPTLNDMVRCRW